MDRNFETFVAVGLAVPVRLVRACGSKPRVIIHLRRDKHGQARKSLWIETAEEIKEEQEENGQARKSLWIETFVI